VAWQRLMREWIVYVGFMAIVFAIFFRDNGLVGALAGLFISGPLYLAFGYGMAKLGYSRKSLKELRTPRAEPRKKKNADDDSSAKRPAPTKRTSGGGNRPRSKTRRR